MSSERWRRARRLFETVLDLPERDRESVLEEACGDDRELRAAVEGWLRADAAASGFLEEPLRPDGALTPPDLAGRELNGLAVEERIGQGGMGTVYRARQKDETFDRSVAVKVLSLPGFSREARRRFDRERRILGGLDHPAIARIFDGGTTEEGFPYLVLEHVPGREIDRYCEEEALSVRQRLRLFRRVCAAVAASHRRLVVHRDLKPSNILVRDDGQPKLLDFGIAKLLDGTAVDGAVDATRPWSRPLTPQYASPEQLRGEDVSTATDVYSLGVLLYKLLSGCLPHEVQGLSLAEVAATASRTPEPPSARLAADPRRRAEVRGDLDSIVLRALRADPEARYASVDHLAEDLDRFLSGLPVVARKGGTRYRLGKWLRRNRWKAAALTTALVGLSAGVGGLGLMNARLAAERAKQDAAVDFFLEVFEQAGPYVQEGVPLTVLEAVDRSAGHLEAGLPEQPAIQATLAGLLGEVYLDLGQTDEALRWTGQAQELHQRLGTARTPEGLASLSSRGAALTNDGRYGEADAAIRGALDRMEEDSRVPPRMIVQAWNELVRLQCFQDLYEAADEPSERALELARERLRPEDRETIAALLQRALVLNRIGGAERAMELYRETEEILLRAFRGSHPDLPTLNNNLARQLARQGDVEGARRRLREADRLYAALYAPDFYERVKPLVALARLAEERGERGEAIDHYATAVEIGRATGDPDYVLRPLTPYADLLLAESRCDEAESALRVGFAALPEADARSWLIPVAEIRLAESLLCLGRRGEASEVLARALADLEPLAEDLPEELARARRLQVALAAPGG